MSLLLSAEGFESPCRHVPGFASYDSVFTEPRPAWWEYNALQHWEYRIFSSTARSLGRFLSDTRTPPHQMNEGRTLTIWCMRRIACQCSWRALAKATEGSIHHKSSRVDIHRQDQTPSLFVFSCFRFLTSADHSPGYAALVSRSHVTSPVILVHYSTYMTTPSRLP